MDAAPVIFCPMPSGVSSFLSSTSCFFLKPSDCWWGSRDWNPDAFQHMILNHARLPVPTLPPISSDNWGPDLPHGRYSSFNRWFSLVVRAVPL